MMEKQSRPKIGREPEVQANSKTLLFRLFYCLVCLGFFKVENTLFPDDNVANIPL